MTIEALEKRVVDLETVVADLKGEVRNADALVGIVAGKSDLQLNLDIGTVAGLPSGWVELIVDRERSGMNSANQ